MIKAVNLAPDIVPSLPMFSEAMMSNGHVYVSGNIGCTPNFKIVEGGVRAQTRTALENMSKILEAAGSGMHRIVKTNVYLTDMSRDFMDMNHAYTQFLDASVMPARTCVGVLALPFGASVLIDCIAAI